MIRLTQKSRWLVDIGIVVFCFLIFLKFWAGLLYIPGVAGSLPTTVSFQTRLGFLWRLKIRLPIRLDYDFRSPDILTRPPDIQKKWESIGNPEKYGSEGWWIGNYFFCLLVWGDVGSFDGISLCLYLRGNLFGNLFQAMKWICDYKGSQLLKILTFLRVFPSIKRGLLSGAAGASCICLY